VTLRGYAIVSNGGVLKLDIPKKEASAPPKRYIAIEG
jgi:hypothetical protein